MFKYIFTCFIYFILFIGCSENSNPKGRWYLELNLQEQRLPFIIEIDGQNGKTLTGHLINSDEKIPLVGEKIKDLIEFKIEGNYSILRLRIDGDTASGEWVRTNRENYRVGFTGSKTSQENIYSKYEKQTNLLNFSGKWKINLDNGNFGLGIFKQVGSRIQGSILTETGDFRFLDGFINNNEVTLTGFDGTFSHIFYLVTGKEDFNGMQYSGIKYNAKISGTKNESFELSDANDLTTLKKGITKLSMSGLVSIEGKKINFGSGSFKNKAKVVQVFGSWCPNCLDETRFLLKWKRENKKYKDDVKIIALAFENFETKAQAIKALKKYKHELQVNYPIVLLDSASTKTVSNYLPFEKMVAFPTTIFLDKHNHIVKIHTGFSGQATGPYFDLFKQEFDMTILKLFKAK